MHFNMILVYGIIVCFFGVALVFVIYFFWKVHHRPDLDSHASVPVSQHSGADKRKDPRTDVNWPVSIETPEGAIAGEARNISLSGAFICCQKPFPLKKIIRFTMTGPDNESILVTAQVVWSNVHLPDAKVVNRGMGVRFIKPSERHLQLVRALFTTK